MRRACLSALLVVCVACGDDDTSRDAAPDVSDGNVGDVSDLLDAGDDVGDASDASPDSMDVAPARYFDNVAERSGITFVRDNDYDTLTQRMLAGVCVIDVDGEAPLDLFFALGRDGDERNSRLYVGQGSLSYADETASRGLDEVLDAGGCLALDVDGDRDDDLILTGTGYLALFVNDGGVFAELPGAFDVEVDEYDMLTSIAAGDLDGDEDLDLVIGGFLNRRRAREEGGICGLIPCAASLNEGDIVRNYVFTWDAGRFHDQTATLAPGLLVPEPTLAVLIADLAFDDVQNIWVGNDYGARFFNRPWGYEEGVYVDYSSVHGLAFNRLGSGQDTMGVSQGDVDNDGTIDFVTSDFERNPSSVFLCDEVGFCSDGSREFGTDDLADTFRWGTALVDLDLDGWNDLVEATGQVHDNSEIMPLGMLSFREQRPNVMRNVMGTFETVDPPETDAAFEEFASRGLAITDLDDDGRPDVVFAPAVGAVPVFRNVREPVGHWLRVVLRGRAPNTGAVGARVTVVGEATSQVRQRLAGEGFLGNFDPRLFFGTVDDGPFEVHVRWPDGTEMVRRDVLADTEQVFTQ